MCLAGMGNGGFGGVYSSGRWSRLPMDPAGWSPIATGGRTGTLAIVDQPMADSIMIIPAKLQSKSLGLRSPGLGEEVHPSGSGYEAPSSNQDKNGKDAGTSKVNMLFQFGKCLISLLDRSAAWGKCFRVRPMLLPIFFLP